MGHFFVIVRAMHGEVLLLVLDYVEHVEIKQYRLVCKEWNETCLQETYWATQFQKRFTFDLLLQQRGLLPREISMPNPLVWYDCCVKLLPIIEHQRIQRLMTPEDQVNPAAGVTVLLHLDLCRAYIGFPDTETKKLFPCEKTYLFHYDEKELIGFVIRYNVNMIQISRRLAKFSAMHRRLSDTEMIIALSTVLKGKLKVQLFVLREMFDHTCGTINAERLTLEFFQLYHTIFVTFLKKPSRDDIDNTWVILRSQIRFVVTDKDSLYEAVRNILWEHPKGIGMPAFRAKFERCTGLAFGSCTNKSLKKYILKFPGEFLFSAKKLFLVGRMR